jgi:hypothetical protein
MPEPAPRPPAPTWEPHFDLGPPGWRQSESPLCTEHFGSMSQAVWSDGNAVFTLVSASCNLFARRHCGGEGASLYRNDGLGWTHLRRLEGLHPTTGDLGLSGFVDGHLIVYRDPCGISLYTPDGNASACTWESDSTADAIPRPVRTFGPRGYALAGDHVLAYDGSSAWTTLATLAVDPFDGASDLALSGESIVIAGPDGFVVRGDASGAFEPLPDVPAGDYWAVWTFGEVIWLGSTEGQLVRFDDEGWTIIETGMTAPIRGLWGSPEGTLYFYGDRDFGRWNGGSVERFAVDPGESPIRFSGMWGNHADEVFLAVLDNSLRDNECSGVMMLVFDGVALRRF